MLIPILFSIVAPLIEIKFFNKDAICAALTNRLATLVTSKSFHKGVAFLILSLVFFARGLDEDHDYLRISHGLWHCFGATSFYFMFSASVSIDIVKGEESHKKQA